MAKDSSSEQIDSLEKEIGEAVNLITQLGSEKEKLLRQKTDIKKRLLRLIQRIEEFSDGAQQ